MGPTLLLGVHPILEGSITILSWWFVTNIYVGWLVPPTIHTPKNLYRFVTRWLFLQKAGSFSREQKKPPFSPWEKSRNSWEVPGFHSLTIIPKFGVTVGIGSLIAKFGGVLATQNKLESRIIDSKAFHHGQIQSRPKNTPEPQIPKYVAF